LNILLIDAKRRFGNEFLLPRGPLREPLAQIRRADLILITKCTAAATGDDVVDLVRRDFPEKRLYKSTLLPDQVKFPLTGKTFPPDFLLGKRVIVFAGLAYPDDFLDMVEGLGAQVLHYQCFPDHHTFTPSEIGAHVLRKKSSGADFLITTEKDWVRIEGKYDVGEEIAVLTVKMRLLSEADSFFDIIRKGILGFDAEGA
jgi:tetraacyldisaccharide 4'-kinase